ncbi:MAG: electron transport complex subunit RsxC [Kangiellaceae bacterium]|nr:electron transport complex subunit RsxC [Kangiellaceae bacterium]
MEKAAIVGLGGAVFPTHIKLAIDKPSIEILIINAMECEPYITCDHRLMIEKAEEILEGALIAAKIVEASKLLIGIEDNKAEAIFALETSIKKLTQSTNLPIEIIVVPTNYPSGGEKQLIQLLTGEEVPNKSYPSYLGIVVQNPATLFAIKKAVVDGFPLTNRLVTITGNACANPGNYWVPFGTSIEHIANQLAIDLTIADEIIFGGPLMGQLINDSAIPTNKSTNCIIFNTTQDLPGGEINSRLSLSIDGHVACIRCGQCETVCPASLIPQQLYWFAKTEQWNELEQQSLFDCIECGACSYVCPSEIPLVNYYRFAKSQIQSNNIKLANSDKAKQRFENREARLARIKFEREAKRRKTAAARKKAAEQKPEDPEGKKTAIQDALARVKKKKENTI